jgi:hypothetical protein
MTRKTDPELALSPAEGSKIIRPSLAYDYENLFKHIVSYVID